MSDNDLLRLRDLTLTYELQPNDLLHVYQNGADYAIRYNNFRNEVIADIPYRSPIWNAKFLDSYELQVQLPEHNEIIIWDDVTKRFTHKYLDHELIDFNSLNTNDGDGNYLSVRNGYLVNREPSITEIHPYAGATPGHFLVVNEDGTRYIEMRFDSDAFLDAPSTSSDNIFTNNSGMQYITSSTSNTPHSNSEGFVVTAKSVEETTASALLFMDVNEELVYLSTNNGNSPNPNAFSGWNHMYSTKHNPLNNGITDSRSNALVTANITHEIQNVFNDEINTLDNSLNNKIDTVDSSLEQHKSSGDHDNRYMRSDTPPVMNVGRGEFYFENNSNDAINGAGITLRPSSNPLNGLPNETGAIFSVRDRNDVLKLWVGSSHTSLGNNSILAKDINADSIKLQRNQTNYNNTLALHGDRTSNSEFANIQFINDSGNLVKVSARKSGASNELNFSGASKYNFDAGVVATNIKTMANRDVYISRNKPSNNIGNNGDIWYTWS